MWKPFVLFYVVLLFHHHLLAVHSEHLRNSSPTDLARTRESTSSAVARVSVNRRGGGGGGHGSGHSGGHASGIGMHGSGNGDHGNLPPTLAGGAIPLYGATGMLHHSSYNHHHGTSDGRLTYVCFYHYLVLFISIAMGVSL